MISTLYSSHQGHYQVDLSLKQIAAALQDPYGLLWLDLYDEPVDHCRTLFCDLFSFHPLAVDDALEETHVPKVDDWGAYLAIVLHAVRFAPQNSSPVDTSELDIFVGQNYLITYHPEPIAALDRVRESCGRDHRHLQAGVGRLLYRLTDELVADYMPVLEAIDQAIDQVEDRIFGNVGSHLLEEIFTLKRGLLHLRRIMPPQRETLNKLARGDFALIQEQERVFFRDVYDHLVRLYDLSEGLRDLVSGALDIYLSVVNNRMNDVMKTLTLITTLFMPISFLVGFFGINFFQPTAPLGAWTGLPAFILTLLTILLVPIAMFLWMRKRAWM